MPIAYLWARTIRCEGPGCGAEIPLLRSLWLSKKHGRSVGVRLSAERRTGAACEVEIVSEPEAVAEANQGYGAPRLGDLSVLPRLHSYMPSVASVRTQLKAAPGRRGRCEADLCVVSDCGYWQQRQDIPPIRPNG